MFQNGKGLFGGGAMASGPKRKKQREKPFWQAGPGRLAMAGQILSNWANGGGGNPLLGMMAREDDYRRQQQMAKQSREWGMQDWMTQQTWDRNNPEPLVRENNMGDVVSINPQTGEATTLYEDPYAKTTVGPDGNFYPLQFMPRRPVGRLTPIEEAPPAMTVTPRELNALVQQYGPEEVQRRLDSGLVAVRNN